MTTKYKIYYSCYFHKKKQRRDVYASEKLSALFWQSVSCPNVLGLFDTKSEQRDRAAWDSNGYIYRKNYYILNILDYIKDVIILLKKRSRPSLALLLVAVSTPLDASITQRMGPRTHRPCSMRELDIYLAITNKTILQDARYIHGRDTDPRTNCPSHMFSANLRLAWFHANVHCE